ncbi:MAG: hypothetical protein ABS70_06030 [Nitrospira sp. SCN 59-13]|nr:MAG: hypothetical protein ABS70_06030 [Nitrospira sp. SCN 59-13]
MTWWTPQLNALLGGLVIAGGIFVMWDQAALVWTLLVAVAATAFLLRQGRSIGAVWAWTTLGLGIESMTWPIVTMVRIRMEGIQATEEQMGTILNAVLFGLFTSVFWVTFALGLFKRLRAQNAPLAPVEKGQPATPRGKKKRSRA